jgi:hypothetical protein
MNTSGTKDQPDRRTERTAGNAQEFGSKRFCNQGQGTGSMENQKTTQARIYNTDAAQSRLI